MLGKAPSECKASIKNQPLLSILGNGRTARNNVFKGSDLGVNGLEPSSYESAKI